jgi:hypothetical protein
MFSPKPDFFEKEVYHPSHYPDTNPKEEKAAENME